MLKLCTLFDIKFHNLLFLNAALNWGQAEKPVTYLFLGTDIIDVFLKQMGISDLSKERFKVLYVLPIFPGDSSFLPQSKEVELYNWLW